MCQLSDGGADRVLCPPSCVPDSPVRSAMLAFRRKFYVLCHVNGRQTCRTRKPVPRTGTNLMLCPSLHYRITRNTLFIFARLIYESLSMTGRKQSLNVATAFGVAAVLLRNYARNDR